MLERSSSRAKPSPPVVLAWGSQSISSVLSPSSASAAARLMAVVVLPTPPFWFTTASTFEPLLPAASEVGLAADDDPGLAPAGALDSSCLEEGLSGIGHVRNGVLVVEKRPRLWRTCGRWIFGQIQGS